MDLIKVDAGELTPELAAQIQELANGMNELDDAFCDWAWTFVADHQDELKAIDGGEDGVALYYRALLRRDMLQGLLKAAAGQEEGHHASG